MEEGREIRIKKGRGRGNEKEKKSKIRAGKKWKRKERNGCNKEIQARKSNQGKNRKQGEMLYFFALKKGGKKERRNGETETTDFWKTVTGFYTLPFRNFLTEAHLKPISLVVSCCLF